MGAGRISWAGMLLVASGTLAMAQSLVPVRDGIDAAVRTGDAAALADYGRQLAGRDGDWADYYSAYVLYRQAQLPGVAKKIARNYLNECIDLLEELVDRRPDMVEAHALHASCLGNSAGFYKLRAITRGSAATKALDQALRLDSGNPRVLLQEGQSLVFRPKIAGGDKEKAMERLLLAAEQFVNWRSPDPDAPVWGEAEAWLTIARLYRDAGDSDAARSAFEQSLAVAPDYRVAREELAALD